jgi:hypothetical protein
MPPVTVRVQLLMHTMMTADITAFSRLTTSTHYTLGDEGNQLRSPVHDSITFDSLAILSEHLSNQGYAGKDLSEAAVMNMMPDQIYSLRMLVHNLEIANWELQTQIYGEDNQRYRYPMLFRNTEPPSRTTIGSYAYRNLLYEQYIKMLAITRKPDTNNQVPTTPSGVKILQEYRTQLALLAQFHPEVTQSSSPLQHSPLQLASRHGARQPFKIAKNTARPHQRLGPRSPVAQNSALQDYQMQLAVLEAQNHRRLELTRQREQAHFPPLNLAGREIVSPQYITSEQRLVSDRRQTTGSVMSEDHEANQSTHRPVSRASTTEADTSSDEPRGRLKLRTNWV